jgi:hypothetical protein
MDWLKDHAFLADWIVCALAVIPAIYFCVKKFPRAAAVKVGQTFMRVMEIIGSLIIGVGSLVVLFLPSTHLGFRIYIAAVWVVTIVVISWGEWNKEKTVTPETTSSKPAN